LRQRVLKYADLLQALTSTKKSQGFERLITDIEGRQAIWNPRDPKHARERHGWQTLV